MIGFFTVSHWSTEQCKYIVYQQFTCSNICDSLKFRNLYECSYLNSFTGMVYFITESLNINFPTGNPWHQRRHTRHSERHGLSGTCSSPGRWCHTSSRGSWRSACKSSLRMVLPATEGCPAIHTALLPGHDVGDVGHILAGLPVVEIQPWSTIVNQASS